MTREDWWKAFAKVMRQMPESVELVVNGSGVNMYPAGALRRHLDRNTGFGMEESPLESIRPRRVYAYGEGD